MIFLLRNTLYQLKYKFTSVLFASIALVQFIAYFLPIWSVLDNAKHNFHYMLASSGTYTAFGGSVAYVIQMSVMMFLTLTEWYNWKVSSNICLNSTGNTNASNFSQMTHLFHAVHLSMFGGVWLLDSLCRVIMFVSFNPDTGVFTVFTFKLNVKTFSGLSGGSTERLLIVAGTLRMISSIVAAVVSGCRLLQEFARQTSSHSTAAILPYVVVRILSLSSFEPYFTLSNFRIDTSTLHCYFVA